MTLYTMRNRCKFAQTGRAYNISRKTLAGYFTSTITGLDKLLADLFPAKDIAWWRDTTPKSSETKMGGVAGVAALDCMESRLAQPKKGWLSGACAE
jgi:hypothetical protein